MELAQLDIVIKDAFNEAYKDSLELNNAKRSKVWIKQLAEKFREFYKNSQTIITFDKSFYSNRAEFGVNELLFDITLVQTLKIPAIQSIGNQNKKQLTGIKFAEWIIESELKQTNTRDLLIDINKLVLSKSNNKMFVISSKQSIKEWTMTTIKEMFSDDSANVFLARIPHPSEWNSNYSEKISVSQLIDGKWLTHRCT